MKCDVLLIDSDFVGPPNPGGELVIIGTTDHGNIVIARMMGQVEELFCDAPVDVASLTQAIVQKLKDSDFPTVQPFPAIKEEKEHWPVDRYRPLGKGASLLRKPIRGKVRNRGRRG